jgi:DNA-binding transcriptional LysR family regulator
MRRMHESFATAPFDLYELHLLQLIAQRGSFTAAAQAAGLTQSAITRQVQGIEARLGAALFERTTRKVAPTRAGTFLLQEGARLLGSVDALLTRFRHDFTDAAKEVRVGVSTTISMAYLPGFFFAQQRRQPDVRLRIIHLGSVALLERLEANELDVSILCPPRRLPMTLKVCHRFEDRFDLIVPATLKCPEPTFGREKKWLSWLHEQPWLLIAEGTSTGAQLRSWLLRRQWRTEDVVEADSFDLIINLVGLGQGISLVPKRALANYGRSRRIQRYRIPSPFSRTVAAVARKHPTPPDHIRDFIANILF